MERPTKQHSGTDSEWESTFTGEQSTSLSISTALDTTSSSRLNATRIELERRQLTHSIQLLKLEISQKNMLIEAMKTEHSNTVEELEEKLSDVVCERKLLQQRLRALTHVYEEEVQELRKQREECKTTHSSGDQTEQRSPAIVSHDREESEENCVVLALQRPLLMDNEYDEFLRKDLSSLNIFDLTRIRVYEASKPFIKDSEDLREQLQKLQLKFEERENKMKHFINSLESEKVRCLKLETRCTELSKENERIALKIQHNNFKIDNYDSVKRERDEFQREIDTVRRALVEKEINERLHSEEKIKTQNELSSAHQAIALLKQDKEYLTKQVTDLSHRSQDMEEKNGNLQEQLLNVKQSKEELYEQFVRSREQQKEEYSGQLQQELESIRTKTNLEMEQLRKQTKDMFERENIILQESRESANSERDRVLNKLKNMEEKYDLLMNEYHQLQVSNESQISDLQSELQMKAFECERSHLLQEERNKTLTQCQKEREKFREKLEVLNNELQRLTTTKDSRIRELESSLKDVSLRLETYESLEKELDDVVMQAAEMENEQDAERVLFSFGFGTSVPSTSRRRMQQSVQLARRVLKLERINVSLRQQLETQDKDKRTMEEKISCISSQLDLSKQPYKYLVESLQSRDNEIQMIGNRNSALEARIRELERERNLLIETKNQMSSDLERLLNQREELSVMKQMIIGFSRGGNMSVPRKEVCQDDDVIEGVVESAHPKPMIFTQQESSSWYRTS